MKRILTLSSFLVLTGLVALAASAEEQGGLEVASGEAPGTSCSTPQAPIESAGSTLSAEELERVASFLFNEILATGRTGFEDEEVEEATGVKLSDEDAPAVREAVVAKLKASKVGRQLLSGSRCQAYEACSLYGDLSGASGDVLAMYEREKAEDGRTFEDFRLPEFTARDLEGHEVSSTELHGQNVLLAFVAVHCQHSMDSLPILQRLTETYGSDGLRVVAVAINSGEVEDVNTWFPSFEPKYSVWVSSGDALGERIGSHLVPTYLLLDTDGRITEKLVGYKQPAAVTERVLAQLATDGRGETEVASR